MKKREKKREKYIAYWMRTMYRANDEYQNIYILLFVNNIKGIDGEMANWIALLIKSTHWAGRDSKSDRAFGLKQS